MWDPGLYLRYGDERGRPFADLLARVGATEPRAVVDLGCGPGTLTATLPRRWPRARVEGLDSSPEMVARARELVPGVRFTAGDVRDWSPAPDVDVVVGNAVLQWVPGHEELLVRWAGQLAAGAWLAFQVPGNFDAPSHRALRAVAADPRWPEALAGAVAPRTVPDPEQYAQLLIRAGCTVDAWETTYLHLLPVVDATHPVLSWMEGTALRPVRQVLAADEWAEFRQRLGERLAQAYPVAGDLVYFPFRRIFVVARVQ
ncbi:MAG: trans-aconitate 2-methyltransferase [Micromonosporaceae bacterium]|jgi:trans-aconitate 2-methyltransferase|nr:trans-aconitate 2-methyltransferase [Micromonosporaceae bacterium]